MCDVFWYRLDRGLVNDLAYNNNNNNNNMTSYQQNIRAVLLEQSVQRFPNNPRLQMLYQIGFLQAQLAEAMRSDNLAYSRFKQCIDQAQRQLNEL